MHDDLGVAAMLAYSLLPLVKAVAGVKALRLLILGVDGELKLLMP